MGTSISGEAKINVADSGKCVPENGKVYFYDHCCKDLKCVHFQKGFWPCTCVPVQDSIQVEQERLVTTDIAMGDATSISGEAKINATDSGKCVPENGKVYFYDHCCKDLKCVHFQK